METIGDWKALGRSIQELVYCVCSVYYYKEPYSIEHIVEMLVILFSLQSLPNYLLLPNPDIIPNGG